MRSKGANKQALRKGKAPRTANASTPGPADGPASGPSQAGAGHEESDTTPSQPPPKVPPPKTGGAAATAEHALSGAAEHDAAHYVACLTDTRLAVATQAARVVDEIVTRRPQAVAGMVGPLARLITAEPKRVVQTAAHALPAIAKVTPARVAKHLPFLTDAFDAASPEGREGLMRTFATLCIASVAYQRRLEDPLKKALATAEPKQLVHWAELVLPTLKGEPHARARAVVESRLEDIPRPMAQKIADFLGIKLRPVPR